MRFPHSTTAAAAVFIALTSPALAQTSGTPSPSTPAPAPATEPPTAGQLPDATGQADGPTREMIRQMVEQAVRDRLQQDRGSEEGFREEDSRNYQGDRNEDADRHDEDGDRWQNHGDRDRGHRMAGRWHHQMMRGAGMRLMFGLLDTDGDGSVSEDEVQRAVGRMFSSVDENGDGKIDVNEIQSFMHGSSMHGTDSEDRP
ncbi:EF-hand domain-containing protein [Mesorhizobium sp. LSJC269B00]|uniref:EF-hand domain-containing protein n=1 Tax=Mesorhizobium sp. LSJC269B00 TaxID=1287326 RepID=UPI0004CE0D2B|nr:EF-hand domain-containing protein [Mesorhizobium sp. LSJC269B00]